MTLIAQKQIYSSTCQRLPKKKKRGLAKMIGCHESKISRTDWRFIASVLCAFGMASDISPISRAFKYALDEITKKKSPAATEDFKQIDMQF
ncbi:hypothetical protein L317_24589 [Escherichia coli SHECO003]|nr:hypothetical protein L317_24589 [Escherichia coli SHECO003]